MNRRDSLLLAQMAVECDKVAERILRFRIDESSFTADSALADLLLMPIVQIGELASRVDAAALDEVLPNSAWREIKGFRNLIVHDYGRVEPSWAWTSATVDVPELRQVLLGVKEVRAIYDELRSEELPTPHTSHE